MESINAWLLENAIPAFFYWSEKVEQVAKDWPEATIAIMSAAFLAGALSRNLLVSMASLILALIAVTNLSPNFGAAVPAIALALLAMGVWQTRRQLDRSTAAMKHILEDRESVMKQLDHEIAWRRVGEEYDLEHPEALIKRSCDAMRQARLATSSTGRRSDLGR